MFWSEYKDHFLSSLGINGGLLHTAKAGEVLGRFTRYTDPQHVAGISQLIYNNYLIRRKQDPGIRKGTTISKTTLNGDITYLNMAFAWVDSTEGLGRDVIGVASDWRVPRVKKAKVGKRTPKRYTEEHVNRVLEACLYARKPIIHGCRPQDWWLTFWCLDLFTGFRKNALLHFSRPCHDELERGEVVLPFQWNKSGSDQAAYLPPIVVEWIRALPAKAGELLLPWPHGHKCFYDTLHHMQSRAGIPVEQHIMPHGGRALFTTGLIKKGANIAIVQQLLGHSTPDILMKNYLNDVTPEKRDAVNRLPIPDALSRTPIEVTSPEKIAV